MELNNIAYIIYQGYQHQGHPQGYLDDKKERLTGIDKYQALLYLNNCDAEIIEFVADKIKVSVKDLRTTINVLRYC